VESRRPGYAFAFGRPARRSDDIDAFSLEDSSKVIPILQ
jgi:hypothetical protein